MLIEGGGRERRLGAEQANAPAVVPPPRRPANKLWETAVALIGFMLLTAAMALAQKPVVHSHSAREELQAQIAQRLKSLLPPDTRLAGLRLECAPPRGAKLTEQGLGFTQLNMRSFMVPLQEGTRVGYCPVSVQMQRRVVLAARNIPANEPLSQEDFTKGWVDAFATAPGALQKLDLSTEMIAQVPLRAGEAIYPTQIARPMAVHAGDPVLVMVRNGAVMLRTTMQARGSGLVGDPLLVINPESGSALRATITGVDTAEVMLR